MSGQRIVVAGIPNTGKTTFAKALAARLGATVHHTDDLLGMFHPEQRRAREASRWMSKPGPWVIEGCTAVRALREWIQRKQPIPADVVYWFDKPHVPLREEQRAFADGCARVWREDVQPFLGGVASLVNPDVDALVESEATVVEAVSEADVPVRRATSDLAIVDRLRALPAPLMRAALAALEAELGPASLAWLGHDFAFWARPAQRLPDIDEAWTLCVYFGEYGAGKTWTATQLFLREVLSGRAKRPRIIAATDNAIEDTIVNGPSGIRTWLPPGVRCEFSPSKGYAGALWIGNTKVLCCSAKAPGQAIGQGVDLDFRDDPAGWITTCGASGAETAWATASRSTREGYARSIVATTPEGVEFLRALLKPGERRGVLAIDLGRPEDNAGNLAASFLRDTVPDLRAAGLWTASKESSPFAGIRFADLYEVAEPKLVEVAVAIDPSLSSHAKSCEVGIVGGGRDARSVVHVRRDASGVLDAGVNGWPSVAWDLAEELQRMNPEASFHFVIEVNRGRREPEALLRGEERIRKLRAGKPETSTVEIRAIVSDRDKCARAISPARVASQGQVKFASNLDRLEGQLRMLTPDGTKSDRADAAVHLINDQAGLDKAATDDGSEEAAAQCKLAAEMNARLSGRAPKGPPPGATTLEPMKVEGAPPGDARYAGPVATARARQPSWRNRSVF